MWEKEAKFGWKMVEQSKKDVPDQKASIADPLSFWAMICEGQMSSTSFSSTEALTGKATDNEVPSKATIKVMTASVRKAT